MIADAAQQPVQISQQSYALLSSEFPADVTIQSFQLLALTNGYLILRVVSYIKQCGDSTTGISCQDYFKQNPRIDWTKLTADLYSKSLKNSINYS